MKVFSLKLKSISVLIIVVSLLSSVSVFAGSYTNSDPNANSGYNRNAAGSYAVQYATSYNSSYYDYTPDGGDCTNFVSQCLGDSNAGNLTKGYDLIRGGYPLYSTMYSWYYLAKSLPGGVSYTWSAAHNFRYHWANVNDTGVNRAYKYKVYTNAQAALNDWNNVYAMLYKGDIMQLVGSADGITWHSMVMHDYAYNSTYGKSDLKYAQHSQGNKDVFLYSKLKSWANANSTDLICFYEIKNGG